MLKNGHVWVRLTRMETFTCALMQILTKKWRKYLFSEYRNIVLFVMHKSSIFRIYFFFHFDYFQLSEGKSRCWRRRYHYPGFKLNSSKLLYVIRKIGRKIITQIFQVDEMLIDLAPPKIPFINFSCCTPMYVYLFDLLSILC